MMHLPGEMPWLAITLYLEKGKETLTLEYDHKTLKDKPGGSGRLSKMHTQEKERQINEERGGQGRGNFV